jgi:hypothetical protein
MAEKAHKSQPILFNIPCLPVIQARSVKGPCLHVQILRYRVSRYEPLTYNAQPFPENPALYRKNKGIQS